MAKRKRLTPARLDEAMPAPETKNAMPRGPLLAAGRVPIADVAHDAASAAALQDITDELHQARNDGRLVQRLPLDQVQDDHIDRDRMSDEADAEDMAALMESLRRRGQQTAIEVAALPGGTYGLISGWRRLTALRKLHAETPEIDTVLAIVRQPDTAADAYQAMVEENEIRSNLSFYERGRIVMRAVDRGVFESDKAALSALFQALPRAKRSKINAFILIARTLDAELRFPTAITEKLGLAMAKAINADAQMVDRFCVALIAAAPQTAAEEMNVLWATLRAGRNPKAPAKAKPQRVALSAGLSATMHPDGRIVLDGPRLHDAAYTTRLLAAIKSLE